MATQAQTNIEALLEKARGEENAGNYGAAESTYQQALTVAPENPELLKRLGVRRYNRALDALPWRPISRFVDARLSLTAHPVGWAV